MLLCHPETEIQPFLKDNPLKHFPLILLLAAVFCAAQKKADTPYTGLGLESVDQATLQRFAPKPLDPSVSRRVQSMLDIKSPGLGLVSPDGKTLHFSWTITGVSQIWKLDGPMRFPRQMTGGETPASLLGFTPDGKFVFISRDRNGEENPGLYLQPAGGGELREIQHKKGVQTYYQWVSDDSRFVYFSANDQKPDQRTLYRYELASGEKEIIFNEPGLWSLADVRPGKFLLQKSLGSMWAEFYELDLATKLLKPVIGQGEREDYSVNFGAGEGEYLVGSNKESDLKRIYLLKDGKMIPRISYPETEISGFFVDYARKYLVVKLLDKGYARFEVYSPLTFEKIPLPDFGEAENIYAGDIKRDGRYMTIGVDKAYEPRVSYVWDWEKKELVKWLAPSSPEIDTAGFSKASLEYYPARDGAKIPMFVRRPKTCSSGPCPVIVSFHGGPEGMSSPGFSAYSQLFVDAGFTLVTPNVRGSEGYGRKWLDADNGSKRLDVVTDIEDCAIHLKKAWAKNGVAPKIGVTGGSYGGYSAQLAMTRFAGAFDAGVAEVGMSNLLTFMMNTAPYRRILRANEYGDPEKDKDILLNLSPITYVDNIKGPLLIIQGANDPRVPVGEALQMYEAVKAKGLDTELIIYPDEGHGSSKRSNQVLSIGHTLRFFEKHLK